MSKIFKFSEFLLNEAVSTKQVIEDVVDFFKKSPVIDLYPEDKDGVREGWLSKEHKLYSIAAIKKYFAKKYSNLNIDNALAYTPSIKTLNKMLNDAGMSSLQSTKLKGQFGDTNVFYSVDLSDSELNSIKDKYEEEFAKRYDKYLARKKEAPKKAAEARAAKKAAAKKAPAKTKKRITKRGEKKNEAFELLIESLFSEQPMITEKNWIKGAIKNPGSLRKSLGKEKGEKISNAEINSEISKLKAKDKDKNKPGLQLGDKDKSKYKKLTLAKTLKSFNK